MKPLTPKHALFVREYLKDLNGTQAAIRAGYSAKTAKVQASQLLTRLNVQEAIAAGQKERFCEIDTSIERIRREIALRAFANMADYTKIVDGKRVLDTEKAYTRDQMAAIQEITEDVTGGTGDGERKKVIRAKWKFTDSLKALELLSRHRGMLQDRVKHEGAIGLHDLTDEELKAEFARLTGGR
jgi:phage terminase small subunit